MGRIWMSQVVTAIADIGRQYFDRPSNRSAIETARRLCDDLLSDHGEASGTALAREVVNLFRTMEAPDRMAFLQMLNDDYAYDPEALRKAAENYLSDESQKSYEALCNTVEAPRQELLRRMNIAPGGTGAILVMREFLLQIIPDHPEMKALDTDIRHLFTSWFNRGFLQFERIEWRTAAAILEKLIAYEAVHEIKGWDDLRRRLADDRRCFAYFHPALADEPLIFVEVALTNGLADRIQPLLEAAPATDGELKPNTAVFYSISNCQFGLTGISFGNLLIKQVVDALSAELPSVQNFATLSPIPGFVDWLDRIVREEPPEFLTEDERDGFRMSDWLQNEIMRQKLQKPLMRLCAIYLTSLTPHGQAIDPVARFHLGNGASIERINWAGDLSEKGLAQAAGLMVNYTYAPDEIIANHEAYVGNGEIALSGKVRALL
ncbi:MAG: malonyl-CoA decarboxylase [Rhodospirillaceae bacterium]|jgi:malonyl-CoA decarboxylase|nr:malonyl-CoA decarboxylase [Rhodospirillaceae bacterium]MBT5459025.1 malonyl-CoA decarboxylase [Rhodospirillaceae bacterium]